MSAPDLAGYDWILLAFSGGKDSLACLCHLLEQGADPRRIELHHHDVDGGGETFMDWPSTTAYCRAVADAFGVPLLLSWREGGFLREMLRDGVATAPIRFERPDGTIGTAGGNGACGTRLRFPQVSADLSVRWCSPYLKIDVMAAAIRAQERFRGRRILVMTGERGEESTARARYADFEPHRTDARDGRRRRRVDHWRPLLRWSTTEVWAAIARHGIVPAPAYRLGWSRLSCAACIFGSADQWATLRLIAPERFARLAAFEERFGCTIRRGLRLPELADRGRPFEAALRRPDIVAEALCAGWTGPIVLPPSLWQAPAGAVSTLVGPN